MTKKNETRADLDEQQLDQVQGGYTLIELLPVRPSTSTRPQQRGGGPEKEIDLLSWG